MKSPKPIPTVCGSTQAENCNSITDKLTNYTIHGKCNCAKNKNGDGYCSVYPGDLPNSRLRDLSNSWFQSSAIQHCNSHYRQPGSKCMNDWWDNCSVERWNYYNLFAQYYQDIQGSEQCVLDTFYSDYVSAKTAFANDCSEEITE